jgi:hypothetical protein
MLIEKEDNIMKNFTEKSSALNNSVPPNTGWIRAVIITTLFLPAGVLAQSAPIDDQVPPQQENEINIQQDIEVNVQQYSQQEQSVDLSEEELDYTNPYQQPVITEAEQDQLDQAQWSLGEPASRRPLFNNFFDAEERAIRSKEEMQQNEDF